VIGNIGISLEVQVCNSLQTSSTVC